MNLKRCFLGIGSNIEPETNLPRGLTVLDQNFGLESVSQAYLGPAIGFSGAPFVNLAASIQTTLDLNGLKTWLRDLEYEFGRPSDCSKFSSRTLDIDILTFGDLNGNFDSVILPRPEVYEHAFVLRPLAEIAPDTTLPGDDISLSIRWAQFQASHAEHAVELRPFPLPFERQRLPS